MLLGRPQVVKAKAQTKPRFGCKFKLRAQSLRQLAGDFPKGIWLVFRHSGRFRNLPKGDLRSSQWGLSVDELTLGFLLRGGPASGQGPWR